MQTHRAHNPLCHLLIIFLVFILKIGPACADLSAYGVAAMEADLLARINQARRNPIDTAVELGKAADALLAAMPDMTDILTAGLEPLAHDSRLRESAISHTIDMLDLDYYSKVSPSGITPDDRISAAGYHPGVSAEVLGVVAFKNFMDPGNAVDILFRNMFLSELSGGGAQKAVLLNPVFSDIGIGICSGSLTVGDTRYNVYVVTCDLATVREPIEAYNTARMAAQLVQLINQARAYPLDVAETLGFERSAVLTSQPEASAYLYGGMPPLAVDAYLKESSTLHTEEMLRVGYFSDISPDGRTAEDRILATGYDMLYAGELIFQYASGIVTTPDEMVAAIFNMIFTAELDPEETATQSSRLMLERDLEDIGVAVACEQQIVEGIAQIRCIGTISAGLKLTWENPTIAGVVFTDSNRDGFYTPGEELPGKDLLVFGNGILTTDDAGQFQLPSEPGIYHISMFQADQALHKEVDLDYDNKGIYFQLDDKTITVQ